MNYTEADHVWFIERIEAYLGGDLAGDELARFEVHAAACLPCEAKLGDGSRADAALRELFAAHRPAAGLEDRAITGVRTSLDRHRPLLLHPKVRRAANVAAAVLVIGAMGYVGKLALDGGSLSRFNPGKMFSKSPKEVVSQIRGGGDRFGATTGNAGSGVVVHNQTTPAHENRTSTVSLEQKSQAQVPGEVPPSARADPIAEAQSQIRAGKYDIALGTIDQILKTDPTNEYARGVRPLVRDKATLAQARGSQRELDEKVEESLNQTEEKRIPYDDFMRYPANWPEINDVRDRMVAKERESFKDKKEVATAHWAGSNGRGEAVLQPPDDAYNSFGRAAHGKQQAAEGRKTVSVPDGGTLLLGGQVLDGTVADNTTPGAGPGTSYSRFGTKVDSKTSGGETAGSGTVLAYGDQARGYRGREIVIQREVGQKQFPLLRAKLNETGAFALNGGTLESNAVIQQPQLELGTGVGVTKSGGGTLVLNGENSYAGATKVTGGVATVDVAGKPSIQVTNGTISYTTDPVTGVPAAMGSSAAHSYYYSDPVKAPQPAAAQHTNLGDVASTGLGRQHGSDNNWAFRSTVAFKDKIDKDGDAKEQGVVSKSGAAAGGDVALGQGETKGLEKLRTKSEEPGVPAVQTEGREKAKPGDAAVANVDEKLKTVVMTDGIDDGPAGEKPAAHESDPGLKANTGTTSLAFKNRNTREYVIQDLRVDVPAFDESPDLRTGIPKPSQTPAKVETRQLENPVQYSLAGENTSATRPATQAASTGVPPAGEQPPALVQRKIIRNGEMIFEVDSFDSTYMQIGKIVAEEAGYIGTTDSEKLPNGKVKGTIVLRVPPDRLDVLILKLRGLGDLKNQRIAAQDVTKQFVDSESLLRADRAMEKRLIDLITNGKGEVKDLVAAEKELGNYREKIEQLEGELRYLQSQVSLSTLHVTLFERDIKTPTAAFEAETVDTAIESEEVEKARADAIKSVEDAKGRIVESQMKRFEAGQLQATIVAEVAPENVGPVIDRLKQLGRVARFDVERKQTTQGGQGAPVGLKLEKRATVIKVSIYNLANIAPRETVNVSLAAEDVEKAYKAILGAAELEEVVNGVTVKAGRVVSSSLNSQRADQTTGNITIEVRATKAAAVEAAIRSAGGTGGEVMHLTVTENPDANNVTRAKRGYVVTLQSLSSVAPRETAVLSVAAKDVPTLYQTLMTQLQDGKEGKGRGKVYASRLEEQDRQNVEAFVDFEIPRGESANVEALLNSGTTSDVFRRNVTRSPDVTNTLDSKVRMQVSILNVGRLRPREESMFTVEVGDPEAALLAVQGIATTAGGRTYEPHLNKDESGKIEGQVVFDVPLGAATATADKLRALGVVRQSRSLTNESVPAGSLAKARFDVTVVNAKQLVAANHGVAARIREGVGTSLDALLLLLEWVIVVAPFVLVLWILWKLFRRGKKTPAVPKPAVA